MFYREVSSLCLTLGTIFFLKIWLSLDFGSKIFFNVMSLWLVKLSSQNSACCFLACRKAKHFLIKSFESEEVSKIGMK